MRRKFRGRPAISICILLAAFHASGADDVRHLALTAGSGALVETPGGVARIATSNPDAVDAVVAGEQEVMVQARAVGQATLFVWSKSGARQTFQVAVQPDLEPLRGLLREAFPGEQIDVKASGPSLALVGKVSAQAVADRALALVSLSAKGAVSNLSVAPAPPEKQILLRVRFAELNRLAASEFGVNLLSTGALQTLGSITTGQFPSGRIDHVGGAEAPKFTISDALNVFAFRPDLNLAALIRNLQTKGLLEMLAEPNLVATNGKEASFLAGGEIPVPVVQSGAAAGSITVVYREFGIRLSFLPQVTAAGTVRLHVKPEVSSIDPANGVTLSGFRIPALSTRRLETDIELAEGQSFAIAGLLDQRATENFSRIPGLAHIPALGALFRSRSTSKSRGELVVIVTPEAAQPGGAPALPPTPVPFLDPGERKP